MSEKFDARAYATQYVDEREVIIWKEIFDAFDTDRDGKLAPRDLLEALSKHNGYHPKRSYIYRTMALYDKDESGNIDLKEFLRMVHDRPYLRDSREDVQRVFNEIDQERKGYIQAQDLRALAIDLKEELTDKEIEVIMSKLDETGEGKISFETFMSFNQQHIF